MRLVISNNDIGKWAAHYICRKILQFHPKADRPFVLGLPTGSTPLAMYKELVRLHERNVLSFKHVVTFNMDEYVGLNSDHPQSYHYYMYHNFFKHVDILDKNVHILNGNATNLELECQSFEKKIEHLGGMNLIVGGVGVDGHIAFNEPGSSLTSITRVKTLNHSTVCANSRFFDNDIKATPHLALTMGIKTILSAEEVLILASGVNKSLAVSQAVEGGVSSMCPISAVQLHSKAAIVCDEDATHELKVKTVKYFNQMQDEYSLIDNDTYSPQL